ncbi:MAG: hypothetical protein QOH06_1330 [Acidobacteriota bacterium]|jgi:hypothetical protein|nr:hypothetical protein [Acidobacteriota bacterium]
MARFEPQPGQDFCLYVDGTERWFSGVQHPRVPSMVHSMEGGKATVYRLRHLQNPSSEYALKVMRRKHQDPALEEVCARLDRLKHLPGLAVCERLCLSPVRAARTIGEYPSLEYAILMPWIQGVSWFDILVKHRQDGLNQKACLDLASNLADVLARLEMDGIAHCDLSSGNFLFDPATLRIELIDVEDLFAPGAASPRALPAGTPGYQHRTSTQGQWSAVADRFAGAILLSEVLGWFDPAVRAGSYSESFFDPAELQLDGCARRTVLDKAIRRQRPAFGDLLEQAWRSRTLEECPRLADWSQACGVPFQWGQKIAPIPAIGTSVTPFWGPLPPAKEPQPVKASWKPVPRPQPEPPKSMVTWKDRMEDKS